MRNLLFAMSALCLSCGGDSKEKEGSTAEPPKVDILFVIDTSASMSDKASALLGGVTGFIGKLERDVDYQVAIISPSDQYIDGFTPGPDPGEVGLLMGEPQVLGNGDSNVAVRFQQNVGCWATCWSGYEMESDPTYVADVGSCAFPESGVVSTQYLDCLCTDVEYPDASADWDDNALCGYGEEKPIESVLQSLCRSTEEPPEACSHMESEFDPERDALSNPDWLRFGASLVVVIVTDEGDGSDLYSQGDDDPADYIDAFSQFRGQIKFMAIGPDLTCDESGSCDLRCNSGVASPTGIRRIQNIVEATGGVYWPISEGGSEDDTDCEVADFSSHLDDLVLFIKGL